MSKKKTYNKKRSRRQKQSPWLWVGIAVALVAILGLALFRSSGSNTSAGSLPSEISVAEAYQKYQQGAFVLDVRTPQEWEEYHAPNTTLIPLDELPQRVDEVPRDQEIVVICRSGNRSQVGRDILLQAGFENVTSVAGGLQAWRAAGYPVVTQTP